MKVVKRDGSLEPLIRRRRYTILHVGIMTIVFSESIRNIEALRSYLVKRGVMAETYHSGKNEL